MCEAASHRSWFHAWLRSGVCEQLGDGAAICPAEAHAPRLLVMLLAVTTLPLLFLVAGVLLASPVWLDTHTLDAHTLAVT